jgi:hypothetical protein
MWGKSSLYYLRKEVNKKLEKFIKLEPIPSSWNPLRLSGWRVSLKQAIVLSILNEQVEFISFLLISAASIDQEH